MAATVPSICAAGYPKVWTYAVDSMGDGIQDSPCSSDSMDELILETLWSLSEAASADNGVMRNCRRTTRSLYIPI